MKKALINISDQPSFSWSDEQREGWDVIYDLPIPDIPVDAVEGNVWNITQEVLYGRGVCAMIEKLYHDGYEVYIMLQGDYSFCYVFLSALTYSGVKHKIKALALPVSARDGDRQFLRWRKLYY